MFPDKKRILCVDGNTDVCEVITLLLGHSNSDYETTSANNIADALWFASRRPFDLYIIDTRYRDGDGLSLCRRLRDIDGHARILFYTNDLYEPTREEALAAGAHDCVTRTVDIEDLIKLVHGILNQGRGLPEIKS